MHSPLSKGKPRSFQFECKSLGKAKSTHPDLIVPIHNISHRITPHAYVATIFYHRHRHDHIIIVFEIRTEQVHQTDAGVVWCVVVDALLSTARRCVRRYSCLIREAYRAEARRDFSHTEFEKTSNTNQKDEVITARALSCVFFRNPEKETERDTNK